MKKEIFTFVFNPRGKNKTKRRLIKKLSTYLINKYNFPFYYCNKMNSLNVGIFGNHTCIYIFSTQYVDAGANENILVFRSKKEFITALKHFMIKEKLSK